MSVKISGYAWAICSFYSKLAYRPAYLRAGRDAAVLLFE
jgi:hypothetical protein